MEIFAEMSGDEMYSIELEVHVLPGGEVDMVIAAESTSLTRLTITAACDGDDYAVVVSTVVSRGERVCDGPKSYKLGRVDGMIEYRAIEVRGDDKLRFMLLLSFGLAESAFDEGQVD